MIDDRLKRQPGEVTLRMSIDKQAISLRLAWSDLYCPLIIFIGTHRATAQEKGIKDMLIFAEHLGRPELDADKRQLFVNEAARRPGRFRVSGRRDWGETEVLA